MNLARLLGGQPFFAGETISLADLQVAPALAFFTTTPEWTALGAPYQNLVEWLTRMEARPNMKATTWESGYQDGHRGVIGRLATLAPGGDSRRRTVSNRCCAATPGHESAPAGPPEPA
jgi:hypothetical protein